MRQALTVSLTLMVAGGFLGGLASAVPATGAYAQAADNSVQHIPATIVGTMGPGHLVQTTRGVHLPPPGTPAAVPQDVPHPLPFVTPGSGGPMPLYTGPTVPPDPLLASKMHAAVQLQRGDTAVTTSWQGERWDDTQSPYESKVPDTVMAAGPSDEVEFTNASYIHVWDRLGNTLATQDVTDYFHLAAGTTMGDPDVIYTPYLGRYVLVGAYLTNPGLVATSSFYLMFSPPASAVGTWCWYMFNTGNELADWPRVSVTNGGYIEMAVNTFKTKPKPHVTGADLFVIPNGSSVANCQGGTFYEWVKPPSAQYVQPARVDANGTLVTPEFISIDNLAPPATGSTIHWYDVTPGNWTVLNQGTMSGPASYAAPPPAQQSGTNVLLEANFFPSFLINPPYSSRLITAIPTWVNYGNTSCCAGFLITAIDPSSHTVAYQSVFTASGTWFIDPSVEQDPNGSWLFLMTRSNSLVYPDLLAIGQSAGGVLSNWVTVMPAYFYFPALNVGDPTVRWGDYSSLQNDVSSNGQIWGTGASVTPWGTWTSPIAEMTP